MYILPNTFLILVQVWKCDLWQLTRFPKCLGKYYELPEGNNKFPEVVRKNYKFPDIKGKV